ncbi:prepilin peptidase [Actinomadura madurae]|uniref:Leader peptidase (Prepilin peptidase) / N-methyltransferase n=1 Tax=Actinomadura madurae TaxID=1993 RepID=A0A1I5DC06_9ACTN|nr:prepilin peptidase [Actinomadura madurae]SFN96743.1 leader peptidase (prepilin peptidase) / N-methyltransferase [Actinomadura madurae]SPT50388.1 Flp pilus assembly protein, protease CpaA [Actinomadura madurae]
MIEFLLVPAGLVVGLLVAPMATPYAGEVSRRGRVVVGLVTAALFGLLGWRAGLEPVLPALLYLAAAGTLLGFIDVQVKRLPDRFTLSSYGIAAALLGAAAPFTDDGLRRVEHALIGGAVLFALYLVQALVVPSGIGLGDVKLSGVLGLYLGWFGQDAWIIGLLATYLFGGLVAIGIMIVRRTRKGEFPFGPYMLVGALVGVLSAIA